MAWKINFPDGPSVDLDDLSPEFFAEIANAEEVGWYQVYQAPAQNFDRLQRILVACAKHAEIDPPEPPKTMREFVDRFDNWLEVTKPVAEKPVVDDFPPTPGDPEIGSGSGSPGTSDGLQTSPDDSQ